MSLIKVDMATVGGEIRVKKIIAVCTRHDNVIKTFLTNLDTDVFRVM